MYINKEKLKAFMEIFIFRAIAYTVIISSQDAT